MEKTLKEIMSGLFKIPVDKISDSLAMKETDLWDSLKHMELIVSIEQTFGIELNKLANKIADLLINQGINSNDVVCLSGTKSLHTFAVMLACLKIGALYSIFDPESPTERFRKILSTCKPKLLIAEASKRFVQI